MTIDVWDFATTRRAWCCAAVLSAAALLVAPGLRAADSAGAKPLTFADFPRLREPSVALLNWARDGNSVIVTYRAPDSAATEVRSIDAATGAQRTLGSFSAGGLGSSPLMDLLGVTGFALSPHQDRLVRFDAGAWKVVDLASGASRVLFESPTFQFIPVAPAWSRDGRYVAIVELIQPEGLPRLDPSTIETKGGVRVIDVGAAADGFKAKLGGSRLTVVDVRDGREAFKVQATVRILDVGWGAGDLLYYSMVDDGNLAQPLSHITEVEVARKRSREIFAVDGMIQPLRTVASPDGRTLVTAYNHALPAQDNFKNLVLIDLATRRTRRLSGEYRATSQYQWTPDGKSIVYGERHDGLTELARVFVDDGRTVRLTDDLRTRGAFRLSPDGGRLAYLARDGYGGHQLVVRSLASAQERVLLDIATYRDRFTLGSFETARWKAPDGIGLHRYLFKPPNFDPERKYPVIVDIHGGGSGAALQPVGPIWPVHLPGPLEWHAWANLGYVVLVPEMRSSGELGAVASVFDMIRDAGGLQADVSDMVAATDWLLSQPFIDAKRAALYGLSAGGGRVNKFLTIDHRYAAAIIQDPIRSGPLETIITQALPPYTGLKIGPQPCLAISSQAARTRARPVSCSTAATARRPR